MSAGCTAAEQPQASLSCSTVQGSACGKGLADSEGLDAPPLSEPDHLPVSSFSSVGSVLQTEHLKKEQPEINHDIQAHWKPH